MSRVPSLQSLAANKSLEALFTEDELQSIEDNLIHGKAIDFYDLLKREGVPIMGIHKIMDIIHFVSVIVEGAVTKS